MSPTGMNRAGAAAEGPFVQPAGRWPANVMHDGSAEVVALFPTHNAGHWPEARGAGATVTERHSGQDGLEERDAKKGSAARFFYVPKTTSADRHAGLPHPGHQFTHHATPRSAQGVEAQRRGNHHPTVKPTELMAYLIKLVTPPGGTVLDPFMGSGSTLKAAELHGFSAIGIEVDAEYVDIARQRIAPDAPLLADVIVERAA
jgi:site-specific DNA-methyltransferase (adenine-specific)